MYHTLHTPETSHLNDPVSEARETSQLRPFALRRDALHLVENQVCALEARLKQTEPKHKARGDFNIFFRRAGRLQTSTEKSVTLLNYEVVWSATNAPTTTLLGSSHCQRPLPPPSTIPLQRLTPPYLCAKNVKARRGFPTTLRRVVLNAVGSGHLFQPGDLLANEKVEGHLGHEQARSRSVGVVDRRSDVLVAEALVRIDGGQAVREDLVENVAVDVTRIAERERERAPQVSDATPDRTTTP